MHLISVCFSSLTIFLFFFFTQCFVLLHFIFLYTLSRLTGEERTKATSRKNIEDCVAKLKTMKISSLNSDDPLRWNCGSRGFTGLWCVIFGYLFIYLFEIMKQIVLYFAYPFYFLKTLFWKIPFLLCFQSIIFVCGMCLITLDLKLVQQDNFSSKI